MKILVCGDRIIDHYQWCKATRLCPEAPAPVLVIQKESTSEGGAALVCEQLKALLGESSVVGVFGSVSNKTRIFADRTLVCRIDQDRYSIADNAAFWNQILAALVGANVVVVSDYNKGAVTKNIATGLVSVCTEKNVPLFVDSKSDPSLLYKGCFAIFPNEDEHNGLKREDYHHIVRKLGPRGCSVDGVFVKTTEQQVFDVSGAGDVFLAAFVAKFTEFLTEKAWQDDLNTLRICADFANSVAGVSVRYLGTKVVQPSEFLREAF